MVGIIAQCFFLVQLVWVLVLVSFCMLWLGGEGRGRELMSEDAACRQVSRDSTMACLVLASFLLPGTHLLEIACSFRRCASLT